MTAQLTALKTSLKTHILNTIDEAGYTDIRDFNNIRLNSRDENQGASFDLYVDFDFDGINWRSPNVAPKAYPRILLSFYVNLNTANKIEAQNRADTIQMLIAKGAITFVKCSEATSIEKLKLLKFALNDPQTSAHRDDGYKLEVVLDITFCYQERFEGLSV